MDEELARHVATVAFKAMSDLTGLLSLLKRHSRDKAEYNRYSNLIASLTGSISSELLSEIFSNHPEIEKEFDAKITKYGKLI